jgi:hypothetical protein
MKNRLRIRAFVLMVLMTLTGCNSSMTEPAKETKTPPGSSVDAKIRRFAPTEITADISHLSEGDRKALIKIIEAAKLLDPLFLRQVWSGNEALQKKLAADTSPEGKAKLHYFRINVGPWSRLDNKEPFIDGAPREKPKNANYYPDDMTKEEFESWVKTLPEAEQRRATGFFSVIRRNADKKLKLTPYSEEYREFLVDKKMERRMYTTFLASAFRSVRFGVTEAHGRGVALQFNYLLDEGAFKVNDANGAFSVDPAKIKDAVRKLTGELLTIEAEGSYEKAKAMLDKYALIRPAMQKALEKLTDVPVDIEPNFPLAR